MYHSKNSFLKKVQKYHQHQLLIYDILSNVVELKQKDRNQGVDTCDYEEKLKYPPLMLIGSRSGYSMKSKVDGMINTILLYNQRFCLQIDDLSPNG